MSNFIFLDTNIFLHYQDFDRIDWLEIIGTRAATIVIPPVTVRELNKQKDTSTRTRIKNRAGSTLRKLFDWFEVGRIAKLGETLDVILEDRDPLINFNKFQLSRELQDDHLIASALMYQSEIAESIVTLVTSDAGLTLTAKANRLRINTKRLDDRFKLPLEPDPNQQRIKELEQEVLEFRQRKPQLSLTFEDKSQRKTFKLIRPIQDNGKDIANKIAEIKQRYPKLRNDPDSGPNHPKVGKGFDLAKFKDLGFDGIPTSDITNYNAKLDDFYNSYAKYLHQKMNLDDLRTRTITLTIWIANEGTAPAEDIDIFMHFPDGLVLLKESELASEPESPQPPPKPRTALEQLRYNFSPPSNIDLSSLTRLPQVIRTPPNVTAPRIKRSQSYDVDINVRRLKHKLREPFNCMYLIFTSVEAAQSFHFDYEILAANIPDTQSGSLHVIIERT